MKPFIEFQKNHRWSFRVGGQLYIANWGISMLEINLFFWTFAMGLDWMRELNDKYPPLEIK